MYPGTYKNYHEKMNSRGLVANPYFDDALRLQYRRRILQERYQYGYSMNPSRYGQRSFTPKSNWVQNRGSTKHVDKQSIREDFDTIMSQIETENGRQNLTFPSKILLLIGPPGSGKTMLAECFKEKLEYNMVLSLREMCQQVMKENKGGKFDITPVTKMMLDKIFTCPKNETTRLIIDDFSSISIARMIPIMVEYAEGLRKEFPNKDMPRMNLKICALTCNKNICVDRKMKNGSSSTTYKSCTTLYKKFYKRSVQVSNFLAKYFQFADIIANENIENVQIRTVLEIEKETNGKPILN